MKTKILQDFQICISIPFQSLGLIMLSRYNLHLKSFAINCKVVRRLWCCERETFGQGQFKVFVVSENYSFIWCYLPSIRLTISRTGTLIKFLFLILILSSLLLTIEPTNLKKSYSLIYQKHNQTFINLAHGFDFKLIFELRCVWVRLMNMVHT